MSRRLLFPLIIIISLLFSSCTNIVDNSSVTSDFSFALSEVSVSNIIKTVEAAEGTSDESKIKINCQLILDSDKVLFEKNSEVLLKNLSATTFDMKEIPFGAGYHIIIKVYYGDYLIYTAESEKFAVDKDALDINLMLKPNQSKITYNFNGGYFKEGAKPPVSYFLNYDVYLTDPFKDGVKFDGWYLENDFSGDKITKLGKSKFLGDVTLYAKWIDFEKISSVAFVNINSEVDYNDKIELTCSEEGASIYYTTDNSEPTTSSNYYLRPFAVNETILTEDKVIVKAIAVKEGMAASDVAIKEYTLKRYTVKFDINGHGTVVPDDVLNLKKTDFVTKPDALNHEGYSCSKWYKEKACENIWNFDTDKVDGNRTLYAKWEPITYNVKFEANGADKGTTVEQQTLTFDTGTALNKNTFVKTGYKFAGWNVATSGTAETNIADESTDVLNLSKTQDATVKLYAQWSPLPNVNNVDLTTGDKQITVAWENPTENIFDHTIISYGGQTISVPKNKQSYVITGLSNGTKYNIKIQASYKTCGLENNSAGVEKGQYAMNPLTEAPVKVGDTVKFGDYPQSYLADKSILTNDTVSVNGWPCKYGTDGYYYTEITSNPYYPNQAEDKTFNDGVTISRHAPYYFRIEPIEWTVVSTNYKGYKLLVSDKALEARCFNAVGSNLNYGTSDMRTYLNGEFCNKAFSSAGQTKISPVTIDSNATKDKIFLLSRDESSSFIPNGQRKSTEYDRTLISSIEMKQQQYKYNALWWERSENPAPESGIQCRWAGGGEGVLGADALFPSVVPALCVSPSVLP